MSGYGIAGTGTALYFSTGNSDPTGMTYTGTTNIQESVVTLSNQLGLLGTFTPSNVAVLDEGDVDLGSGGVLLLPSQGGNFPDLAVTAGKDGKIVFAQSRRHANARLQLGRSPRHPSAFGLLVRTVIFYGLRWD